MLLPGLMARAIRSPELSDEELFTSAVRSMLVRSAVRSVCIRNSVRSSSGPFREMAFVEQDAWLAAGVSVSNEFHRIEPYEETGDNDVGGYEVGGREAEAHRAVGQGADSLQPTTDGPRQADHESAARSGLEQEAALALGIPDPTEARLLTAVCRFALKARSNNRAAGLRSELKRRAMMEEQAISEFGEPEMTGPGVEVEALAMEESLLASALAELRRDHDPLSEDAAAALELVHRIIQEERSAASTEPSTTGLEELLGWFESNYPPLAGNYGGHASLHWSLAQVTRPHHVVWPSVNGPGPRARKFVSRLKSRFGAFSLEVER
jgi:hypothetical protein